MFKRYTDCIQEIRKDQDDVSDQIEELRNKRHNLRQEMLDLDWGSPDAPKFRQQIRDIDDQIEELRDKQDALHDEIMEVISVGPEDLFGRPEHGFGGALCKPLGSLPRGAKLVEPTAENLASVGSYRLAGFAMFMFTLISVTVLMTTFPWMRTSPGSLILDMYQQYIPSPFSLPLAIGAIYGLHKLLVRGTSRPNYEGKFLDKAAMYEEQLFRMGAESWSPWRRVYSCVGFSLIHLVNVIYPVGLLLVIVASGGILMWVYLREYKRSGSSERGSWHPPNFTPLTTASPSFCYYSASASLSHNWSCSPAHTKEPRSRVVRGSFVA